MTYESSQCSSSTPTGEGAEGTVGLRRWAQAPPGAYGRCRRRGAGGRARTCTPRGEGDFKRWERGRQLNALLSRCLVSSRGLRIATVVYEGHGKSSSPGQLPTRALTDPDVRGCLRFAASVNFGSARLASGPPRSASTGRDFHPPDTDSWFQVSIRFPPPRPGLPAAPRTDTWSRRAHSRTTPFLTGPSRSVGAGRTARIPVPSATRTHLDGSVCAPPP